MAEIRQNPNNEEEAFGSNTGGSVFTRTPIRDVQLVQVELPSYRAGCGGIDLYSGGFSFLIRTASSKDKPAGT